MTIALEAVKEFRKVCGRVPRGVTVATLIGHNNTPCGITLSSFTSVSLQPPMILVCIDHRSQIIPYVRLHHYLGVNVLSEHQQDLSRQFSGTWDSRFVGVEWYRGRTGIPVLAHVLAILECQIRDLVPAGDHIIVVSEVLHLAASAEPPLMFVNSTYARIMNLPE